MQCLLAPGLNQKVVGRPWPAEGLFVQHPPVFLCGHHLPALDRGQKKWEDK